MNDRLRNQHPAGERLSDYLDEQLGARERESVSLHLESCAVCAATLAELVAVRERARSLPPLAAPDSVWASIEARLGAPEQARVIDLGAERERRRWSFTTPQLAAAAAALIVVSATAAWFVGHQPAPATLPPTPSVIAAQSNPAPPETSETAPAPPAGQLPPATLASRTPGHQAQVTPAPNAARGTPATSVNFGVDRYDTAIADLERILAQNRSRLSPATVQVVEKNLALIDGAIEDARRALAADPASPYLNDHLAQTMKRKADLLRRVTSRLQS